MNIETVKQEIANILSTVKQPSRKQYPVAKHQIATLTELGLLELMPAGYGYTDAASVISAAQDSGGKQVGEGDMASTSNASTLYTLLNEVVEAPAAFVKGQAVRVMPHITYSDLSIGASTSWLLEHRHNGYKHAIIRSFLGDGAVEVEVNQFGDIDIVDIKHLEAIS